MYLFDTENPQYFMEAEERVFRKVAKAIKNYWLEHADEINSAMLTLNGNCYVPVSGR